MEGYRRGTWMKFEERGERERERGESCNLVATGNWRHLHISLRVNRSVPPTYTGNFFIYSVKISFVYAI